MKWTKQLDDQLIKLINSGKRHNEISIDINMSKRSIANRCFRLKLKTIYHKEVECKQCGNFFLELVSDKRLFCSSKCSGIFNSTGRVHSEDSKEKTRKKLKQKKNTNCINNINVVIKSKKIDKKRKCKYCNEYKIDKKHKSICDDCRTSYYEFYRPSCEFKFDINQYKNEFDFNLVKKYGWYSPVNKGNNLNGVSRDHLYSVRDGFVYKIDFEIIKHPANCRLLKHNENSSKHCNSTITIEELKNRIKDWDKKYMAPWVSE